MSERGVVGVLCTDSSGLSLGSEWAAAAAAAAAAACVPCQDKAAELSVTEDMFRMHVLVYWCTGTMLTILYSEHEMFVEYLAILEWTALYGCYCCPEIGVQCSASPTLILPVTHAQWLSLQLLCSFAVLAVTPGVVGFTEGPHLPKISQSLPHFNCGTDHKRISLQLVFKMLLSCKHLPYSPSLFCFISHDDHLSHCTPFLF